MNWAKIICCVTLFAGGVRGGNGVPSERLFTDWLYQDRGADVKGCFTNAVSGEVENGLVAKVLAEVPDAGLEARRVALANVAGADPRWRELYAAACEKRRGVRLAGLEGRANKFVYAKRYFLSGVVHYAWTEDQTGEQYRERNPNYRMGASLELLTVSNGVCVTESLVSATNGVVRDPNVSYDGTKVVFSMRRNDVDDDFHLYVLELATRSITQITFGVGVSDVEPCWLADGGIVFVSSRCVQSTDCWRQSVSNLYTCDAQGRFLRRLGFDQVHTNYPQPLNDGRVIYTRWEYNDRGQIFPQPLLVMNADGTAQSEYYGGNSWFPTSILHARAIPGSQKVIAIAAGHHTMQKGKLILIDRTKGTQEAAGIEYLAPRRVAVAERNDHSGAKGDAFQYPYAFDESNYLVTYSPEGTPQAQRAEIPVPFGIYFMTDDGRRELLAWDAKTQCAQAVPIVARVAPERRPSQVDLTKNSGTYYIQDVHEGQAMQGVPRGTVKSLRVVAIEYRAADAYYNSNIGEAGRSHARTPPSINNGSWDVKHVLGTVPVEPDGSAYFEVPARTPVYFQLLDAQGRMVQTMRSWSTLQPGERQTCVGCHESKINTPPPAPALAMKKPPHRMDYMPPNPVTDTTLSSEAAVRAYLGVNAPHGFGPAEGFSYARNVQPILDKHCVKCHTGAKDKPFSLGGEVVAYTYDQCPNNGDKTANPHRAFTASYLNLTKYGHGGPIVNWISAQSRPSLLPPYFAGSAKSSLMDHLEPAHNKVRLTDVEKRTIACWIDLNVPFCGSYTEANQWEDSVKATYAKFEAKRARLAEEEIANLRKLAAEHGTYGTQGTEGTNRR